MSVLLLDTNVLRYKVGTFNKLDVSAFWDYIIDPSKGFDPCVPDETLRELEIHKPLLKYSEVQILDNDVLPGLEKLDFVGDIQREHLLRELAMYVKVTYKFIVPPLDNNKAKEMHYPSASDARIILTALDNEAVIVTKNIKDFMVYLVFGFRLWDPVANRTIFLPDNIWNRLQQDSLLQEMIENVKNYVVKE